jgi:hypothetical protein
LAQKLSGNGLLVTLDVGSNGIGDVGAAALAEGLKLNTTLQKLDLRWVGGQPNSAGRLASDRLSQWVGGCGWVGVSE